MNWTIVETMVGGAHGGTMDDEFGNAQDGWNPSDWKRNAHCPICFDCSGEKAQYQQMYNHSWVSDPCDVHGICRSCLARYVELKVLDEGKWKVRCPGERCRYELLDADIELAIEGSLIRNDVLERLGQLRSASYESRLQAVLGAMDESAAWIFEQSQPCPKCFVITRRETGCPHMVCRCGSEFCFKCGAPWPIFDGQFREGCLCSKLDWDFYDEVVFGAWLTNSPESACSWIKGYRGTRYVMDKLGFWLWLAGVPVPDPWSCSAILPPLHWRIELETADANSGHEEYMRHVYEEDWWEEDRWEREQEYETLDRLRLPHPNKYRYRNKDQLESGELSELLACTAGPLKRCNFNRACLEPATCLPIAGQSVHKSQRMWKRFRGALRWQKRVTEERVWLESTLHNIQFEEPRTAELYVSTFITDTKVKREQILTREALAEVRLEMQKVADAERIRQAQEQMLRKQKREEEQQYQEWYQWLESLEMEREMSRWRLEERRRRRLVARRVDHIARALREAEMECLDQWCDAVCELDKKVFQECQDRQMEDQRAKHQRELQERDHWLVSKPLKDDWVEMQLQDKDRLAVAKFAGLALAKINRARLRKKQLSF